MHVDLNAFFASAEERVHPEYRGKPLVVGADPKHGAGRGVVSTASYEARKFGIRSGMPISKAWNLCENKSCIFVPVNFSLYAEVSERVMAILKDHADKFEQLGIDEAFLDITAKVGSIEESSGIAKSIKMEILKKEGLTCSIGVGPNKAVAKIASDFKKPDGLTIVRPDEVDKFLSPLPVDSLWGVGKKTAKVLDEMGIKTVGDLAHTDPAILAAKFGKAGIWFYNASRGIDYSEVIEDREPKSFGRETTFEKDTVDCNMVFSVLSGLARDVHSEISDSKYAFRTVEVKLRFEDFETHTHSKTLKFSTGSFDILANTARALLEPFLFSDKKIRLIGVRVSNLSRGDKQKTLFD